MPLNFSRLDDSSICRVCNDPITLWDLEVSKYHESCWRRKCDVKDCHAEADEKKVEFFWCDVKDCYVEAEGEFFRCYLCSTETRWKKLCSEHLPAFCDQCQYPCGWCQKRVKEPVYRCSVCFRSCCLECSQRSFWPCYYCHIGELQKTKEALNDFPVPAVLIDLVWSLCHFQVQEDPVLTKYIVKTHRDLKAQSCFGRPKVNKRF